MSAWPIIALTSDSGNACTASVPNVWRRSWKTIGSRLGAQPAESGSFERRIEALSHGVVVERHVVTRREHEVVGAGVAVAAAQPVENAGDLAAHRHAADPLRFGRAERGARVTAAHVNEPLREVNVGPAQRPQLAHP